jgi:hypothetical protein
MFIPGNNPAWLDVFTTVISNSLVFVKFKKGSFEYWIC